MGGAGDDLGAVVRDGPSEEEADMLRPAERVESAQSTQVGETAGRRALRWETAAELQEHSEDPGEPILSQVQHECCSERRGAPGGSCFTQIASSSFSRHP